MSAGEWTRREFVRRHLVGGTACAAVGAGHLACSRRSGRETGTRVIVLGLDGMDPEIVGGMMRDGLLPTFARVAREGFFGALGTSDPPQSPVAWANFITGCNPGTHAIFDFIHRDPATYLPFLSCSRTTPPSRILDLGDWRIPLSGGGVENLRRGRAFWEILEDHDVPATVFKIPSNFPPSPTGQRTFSGMGTPDVLGTYGTFSYYTEELELLGEDLGGGRVFPVEMRGETVTAAIPGPPNSLRRESPATEAVFTVVRDPRFGAARITLGGTELVLNEGEWSDWVHVEFPMAPPVTVHGICRFFLKQVRPTFKLYVSPVNIDPADPAMPLSTPEDYAQELAARFGPFHTKGLPADTKALDQGVLDEAAFLADDARFLGEQVALFEYELARFEAGLLFFYISSTDQRSHMFWRLQDPRHPAYDASLASEYRNAISATYQEMDQLLARALQAADEHTLLLAISDHGFSPFYRAFHVNSWLREAGYLKLRPGRWRGAGDFLRGVDWSRTRAYAYGLNGLYVNRRGREGQGIVADTEVPALVAELVDGLERVTDPETGTRAVRTALAATSCYSGPRVAEAPDLVLGYERGWRGSWQTALGQIPNVLFATNDAKWSGDHCMASEVLPGILLANRPLRTGGRPNLCDVTATVLDALGVPADGNLDGHSLL